MNFREWDSFKTSLRKGARRAREAIFLIALATAATPLRAAVRPATAAPGSVPSVINYQGSLNDNGAPVTGSRQMQFRVYDAASGGALLWDSGVLRVDFDHGVFNAPLSISTTALSGGGARYLEIEIDATVLAPRDTINSVPYALVAKAVEGSLDISGGALSVTAPSLGSVLYVSSQTGSVGIGTSSPVYKLDVQGDIRSTGTVLAAAFSGGSGYISGNAFSVGSTALVVTGAGVGIGTSSPDQKLTVLGNISQTGVLISSGAGNNYFAGSVGIGTTAPASRLHVLDGDIRLSNSGAPSSVIRFPDGTTRASASLGVSAGPLSNASDALIQADSGGAGTGNILLCTGATCTGAVNKLIVTNAGSVGIGAPAPATLLEVNGAAQFGAGAAKSTFTAAGNLQMVSGSTITSNGTLTISTAASAATTGVPNLFIDKSGRVGVGTASPLSTLHSAGDIRADGAYRASGVVAAQLKSAGLLQFGSEGPADTQIVSNSASPLMYISQTGTVGVGTTGAAPTLFTVGSNFLAVTAAGYVGVGTSSPGARLHVSSGSMIIDGIGAGFSIGISTFIVTSGAVGVGVSNPINLFQVAAGTLTATSGGNVGIGTLVPAANLDVAGVVQIGSGTAKSSFTNAGNLIVPGDITANTFNGGVILTNPMGVTLTLNGVPSLRTTTQAGINVSTHLFVSGNMGVGTTSPGSKLHMSSGTLTIDGTNPGLSVGGSVLVAAQGNVGVGTSNPGTKLHLSSGTLTIDGASPGLNVGISNFVVSQAKVGVGTSNPATKLHMSSGTLTIDGTSPGITVGATTLVVTGGQVGVGTSAPGALLDVSGVAQFGSGAAKSTFTAAGNLQLVSGSTLTSNGTFSISTAASAATTGLPSIFIDASGRVGIGNSAPGAKLAVGTPLTGSSLSSTFVSNAGALGPAAGNELALASIGFLSGNNSSLGIRAMRAASGTDWSTTAIGLGMDVDNTVRAGATLWLNANGNVGIGTSNPASKLTLQDGDLRFTVTSGVRGIYFQDGSYQTTAAGSSQWVPSGSDIFNANTGNVGIGTTNPTAKLHIAVAGQAKLDLQDTVSGGTPAGGSRWRLFADNVGGAGGSLTFGVYDVANSALRMGLDNSGNLGIGTNAPGAMVDVAGNSTYGMRYLKSGVRDSRITVGDPTKSWSLASGHSAGGDFSIVEEVGSPTDRFYIKQGGKVGIGTTDPAFALSVVGGSSGGETVLGYMRSNFSATNTASTLRLTNSTADDGAGSAEISAVRTNAGAAGDADLIFRTSPAGVLTERMRITAAGRVGIGVTNPAVKLHILGADGDQLYLDNAGEQYTSIYLRNNGTRKGSLFWDDSGTSLYLQTNVGGSSLYMGVNGGNNLNINSSGQVGIGLTNPDTQLVITGDGSGLARIGGGTGCGSNFTGLSLNGQAFSSCNNYNFLSSPSDTNLYINRPTGGGIRMRENNADQMTIASGGSVGIGITNPAVKLQVVGDIRVGTSGTNGCLQRFDGAALVGSCSSDERLKKNILPVTGALDKVSRFRPVTYEWRIDEFPERRFGPGKSYGLLAQEVEKVLPELVGMDDKGFRTVSYGVELEMLLIQSIKELEAENKALKDRISKSFEEEEGRLEALRRELDKAESARSGAIGRKNSRGANGN